MKLNKKVCSLVAGVALAAVGFTQVQEILKIFGVGAAVQEFGKDINKAINGLTGHKDTAAITTKVVPIISGGINSRTAVDAAQVMGPNGLVDQVNAVAQLEQPLRPGDQDPRHGADHEQANSKGFEAGGRRRHQRDS